MFEQPTPERNCGCPEYVVACSHIGDYRVILVYDGERYGAAMCKDKAFFNISAATGTEGEMTEHFGNLDALMRAGSMERLMEFADA